MIRFNNVSKHYGKGHTALKHINFHLDKGEMAFLTGHSGAGKSTLIKLIMGLETISQGHAMVNDVSMNRISSAKIAKLRRSMGVILQDPQLIPHRTVYENVALPLIINGMRQTEIPKRVRPALEMVGLQKKANCLPSEISCGEQQRVSIARAIVAKPKLVLADEPTGNLDPKLSKEIMRLFDQFNQVGVTVLIATHDLGLITTMRHRIVTLRDGKLVDGGRRD